MFSSRPKLNNLPSADEVFRTLEGNDVLTNISVSGPTTTVELTSYPPIAL